MLPPFNELLILALMFLICKYSSATSTSVQDADGESMQRDLICYDCPSGPDCPTERYQYHVKHLVIGCQACYKEWNIGLSKRKCFHPSTFVETNGNETDGSCGVIEKDGSFYNYCFCYTDYCNPAAAFHQVSWRSVDTLFSPCILISLAMLVNS